MPALDHCEPEIIRAFNKAGWEVDKKPYEVRVTNRTLFIDFSLKRQSDEFVIIEAKCFSYPDKYLRDFYGAIGQYQFYKFILEEDEDYTPLYLVIPDHAYLELQRHYHIRSLLVRARIKSVRIDLIQKELVEWIH